MSAYYAPLATHKAQLAKARRAFAQNPTPALANAIRRLEQAIRTQRRSKP